MSSAEDLEQELKEALERPLSWSTTPIIVTEPNYTYRVTSRSGLSDAYDRFSTVEVTGQPRFEDGDLIFYRNGVIVRAFARGVWTSMEIVE